VAFIVLDGAKEKHGVAIADDGRDGEVRYMGEIDNSLDTVRKLLPGSMTMATTMVALKFRLVAGQSRCASGKQSLSQRLRRSSAPSSADSTG
jgi:hypothetical protein